MLFFCFFLLIIVLLSLLTNKVEYNTNNESSHRQRTSGTVDHEPNAPFCKSNNFVIICGEIFRNIRSVFLQKHKPNALVCDVEASFRKFLDADLDADDFKNVIGTSLSKVKSPVIYPRRSAIVLCRNFLGSYQCTFVPCCPALTLV